MFIGVSLTFFLSGRSRPSGRKSPDRGTDPTAAPGPLHPAARGSFTGDGTWAAGTPFRYGPTAAHRSLGPAAVRASAPYALRSRRVSVAACTWYVWSGMVYCLAPAWLMWVPVGCGCTRMAGWGLMRCCVDRCALRIRPAWAELAFREYVHRWLLRDFGSGSVLLVCSGAWWIACKPFVCHCCIPVWLYRTPIDAGLLCLGCGDVLFVARHSPYPYIQLWGEDVLRLKGVSDDFRVNWRLGGACGSGSELC